jgi:hypothetical protein
MDESIIWWSKEKCKTSDIFDDFFLFYFSTFLPFPSNVLDPLCFVLPLDKDTYVRETKQRNEQTKERTLAFSLTHIAVATRGLGIKKQK